MTLYLIRGKPGSGKSTYAKNTIHCLHLEADMYFQQEGRYMWNASALATAHRWCLQTAGFALDHGMDVCVSNTFSTRKELQPYLDEAESIGAAVVILCMTSQFTSTHAVPESVIEAMNARWEAIEGEIEIPRLIHYRDLTKDS